MEFIASMCWKIVMEQNGFPSHKSNFSKDSLNKTFQWISEEIILISEVWSDLIPVGFSCVAGN